MSKSYRSTFLAPLVCLSCLSLVGCRSEGRDREMTNDSPAATEQPASEQTETAPPADNPEPATSATAEPPAASEPGNQSEEDLEKAAKEEKERERKLAQLERDLQIAHLKLEKTELSGAHAEMHEAAAIEKAEIELALAEREMQTFLERDLPARLERAELNLQYAVDRFTEAREELEQLELMYEDEEFADQTREIVLERGRRRLERSQRDLEIRRAEHATLLEEKIPVEKERHERAVIDKRQALKRAGEDAQKADIDRRIGMISARAEIIRVEQALEDLRAEVAKAAEEKAEQAAETASSAEPAE